MIKIIGYRDVGFTVENGDFVEGRNYYIGKDIDPKRGAGVSCEKIFVSDAKLKTFTFMPCIGDEVEIVYNKYGKCIDFRPC